MKLTGLYLATAIGAAALMWADLAVDAHASRNALNTLTNVAPKDQLSVLFAANRGSCDAVRPDYKQDCLDARTAYQQSFHLIHERFIRVTPR